MTKEETKTTGQRRKEALEHLCKELKNSFSDAPHGNTVQTTLKKQARILEGIMAHSILKAMENNDTSNLKLWGLALNAQNQCRKTIMAIHTIQMQEEKIKMMGANYTTRPSPLLRTKRTTPEKIKATKQTIQTIRKPENAQMDRRIPRAAAENDNEIKAVGEINRPQNHRRQGNGCLQPNQTRPIHPRRQRTG